MHKKQENVYKCAQQKKHTCKNITLGKWKIEHSSDRNNLKHWTRSNRRIIIYFSFNETVKNTNLLYTFLSVEIAYVMTINLDAYIIQCNTTNCQTVNQKNILKVKINISHCTNSYHIVFELWTSYLFITSSVTKFKTKTSKNYRI